MTSLHQHIQEVLGEHGPLAAQWPGFKPRQAQTDMALAVADALQDAGVLVVEAGTGVGKTFAYLVPVLLSGQRALISTATKPLQDQLFARDLPRLTQVLNLPVRVALLKGRASYLCLHRMEQSRQHPLAVQTQVQAQLARIERWAQLTRSGDLAELPGMDEAAQVLPLVTSTRENCLGSNCPRYKACHVNLARKEAMAADVVVINHHLFFADLAVRESGVAELLPTVRVTVFDEAHQLNKVGVNFLGQEVSTTQLLDLARDALGNGLTLARGWIDWQALAQQLDTATRQWRLVAGERAGPVRLRWTGRVPDSLSEGPWFDALHQLQQALQALAAGLERVAELAPDFVRLLERTQALRELIARFTQDGDEEMVRWLEVSAVLRMVQAPLDVAQTFARLTASKPAPQADARANCERMLSADPRAQSSPDSAADDDLGEYDTPQDIPHNEPNNEPNNEPYAESSTEPTAPVPARSWVFTSATLGDDAALSWFTAPCGLSAARTLRVGSPFDYAQQAALYVPQNLCAPGQPGHAQDVAHLVWQAACRLGGRTLVLTTSLAAKDRIAYFLQQHAQEQSQLAPPAELPGAEPSPAQGPLEVLVQGQMAKRLLMDRFRQGDSQGQRACVLVASISFWEGFDVPGDALQLVVIDKLPFTAPDDPVFEAQAQRLKRQGRNDFAELSLPQAAVMLKQGAGRLIRTETDRGILVVCDPRLAQKNYGQRLLRALPPMRRIRSAMEFEQALMDLSAPLADGGVS